MKKIYSLSPKSIKILGLIARRISIARIVKFNADIKHSDITYAIDEALACCGHPRSQYHKRMVEIKTKYPQACQPWTIPEEQTLLKLANDRVGVEYIARQMGRQPSAIQAHLEVIMQRNSFPAASQDFQTGERP